MHSESRAPDVSTSLSLAVALLMMPVAGRAWSGNPMAVELLAYISSCLWLWGALWPLFFRGVFAPSAANGLAAVFAMAAVMGSLS